MFDIVVFFRHDSSTALPWKGDIVEKALKVAVTGMAAFLAVRQLVNVLKNL